MRKVGTFLAVLLLLGTVVACSEGEYGEDCEEEGVVDGECVDGAVCGRRDSQTVGSLVCLKQCTTQADCGPNEDCNGVGATSLKGCRAKKP